MLLLYKIKIFNTFHHFFTFYKSKKKSKSCKINQRDVTVCYHGDSERVDVFDVQHTVLPGDETLHVDVQLIPDGQDRLKVLLIPLNKKRINF